MAEVYLARQRGMMNFEKLVVVKTIHAHLARHRRFIDMLIEEARLSALIKHPHVVDIYDVGVEDETYFIAMEYLRGESLSSVITTGARRRAPMDYYSTARIVADAADGLQAAHELTDMAGEHLELIHRDVSPGNIIVLYDGGVKLVDFGVAQARDTLASSEAQLAGKTGYTAPELFDGAPADQRTDVFGLGVVMWEALTSRRLFRARSERETVAMIRAGDVRTPSELRRDLPPELDRIVMRAIARDPKARYQTARELHRDLEDLLHRGSYRREAKSISRYMQETFAERIRGERDLIRRATAPIAPERLASDEADVVMLDFDSFEMIGDATRQLENPLERAVTVPAAGSKMEPRLDLPLPAPMDSRGTRHGVIDDPLDADDAPTLAASSIAALIAQDGHEPSATPFAAEAVSAPMSVSVDLRPTRGRVVWLAGGAATLALATIALLWWRSASESSAQPLVLAEPQVVAGTAGPEQVPTLEIAPDLSTPEAKAAVFERQGAALFEKGDLDRAQTMFQKALKTDSQFAPAYRGLGLIYEKRGDSAHATWALNKYLELAPQAGDAENIRQIIAEMAIE